MIEIFSLDFANGRVAQIRVRKCVEPKRVRRFLRAGGVGQFNRGAVNGVRRERGSRQRTSHVRTIRGKLKLAGDIRAVQAQLRGRSINLISSESLRGKRNPLP